MNSFAEQALVFLGIELAMLAALFTYAFYKAGWDKTVFMKNWVMSEGKKTTILKAVVVITTVPILFAFLLHSANAKAEEIRWFDGGSVFVGIDNTTSPSPFCQNRGIDDRLTSNIGAKQNVVSWRMFDAGLKGTHHSCALNADKNAYDSWGFFAEWHF